MAAIDYSDLSLAKAKVYNQAAIAEERCDVRLTPAEGRFPCAVVVMKKKEGDRT